MPRQYADDRDWIPGPETRREPDRGTLTVVSEGKTYVLIFNRLEKKDGKLCLVFSDPFDDMEAFVPVRM